jgi:hypothetical protein
MAGGQLGTPIRPVVSPRSHIGTIPARTEALQRAEFYPISLYLSPSLSLSLSLLLWTAIKSAIGPAPDIYPISLSRYTSLFYPPAIGSIPSLSFLIPDWSTQSTGLLYNRDPFALGTFIALMMEATRTSETSVDNYFTQPYIPEDKSELHTRRRENLKSHM